MAKLFIVLAYFLTLTLNAQQNDVFTDKMELALEMKDAKVKTQTLESLSKDFPKEWLADYYLAQITIKNSMIYLYDIEKLSEELAKAQAYLDKAYLVDNNDEAELLLLQGKLYLVYIMSNPDVYGRKYAPICTNIYNKAYKLAPENPRVVLSKAQWEIGSAKYFGASTEEFCKQFEKAVKLFDTFKLKSPIYPNWGLTEAQQSAKNCQ